MNNHARKNFEAHEALKMRLRLNGISLAEIARQVGVSRTTVSLVGLRKLQNSTVERAIADALGVPAEHVYAPVEKEKSE